MNFCEFKQLCELLQASSQALGCNEITRVFHSNGTPLIQLGDVKPGATVIDVGINRIPAPDLGAGRTRVVGDADHDSCREVAAFITPVPGGVGLMTVACLLRNTVVAACARRGWPTPSELD